VQKSNKGDSADLPAVLGSYDVDRDVVRFRPRFPLTPGVRYHVIFHPSKIPGSTAAKQEPIIGEIFLPKPVQEPTVVQQIYPSGNQLPENQLRFYIHFSSPMRQGEAYEHIHLLDSSGKPVDQPFLELAEELWDPEGKRLTLLLNPGRIKKGLKPREELGPIMEAGKNYSLVIDPQWNDAYGNPLREGYRKVIQAGAALETSPDPKTWKIQPPSSGSILPLRVTFSRFLDHALLQRMITVADVQGRPVAGTVAVAHQERSWDFTPAQPWQVGSYHLIIDTRLEDPAGNSVGRPFEVDVFHRIERQIKSAAIQLPFEIRATSR
jgi:hypothetical protein